MSQLSAILLSLGLLIGFDFIVRKFILHKNKTSSPEAKKSAELSEAEEAVRLRDAKVCPPHSWQNYEIKDEQGNLIKWKLVCKHCGPLGSQDK